MRIGIFIIIILVAVFSYGGMYLIIRSVKNISKLRKDILRSIPILVLNAALIFFLFTFGNYDVPKINDSGESIQTFGDVEKRIMELEMYTQRLEVHIYYSQLQFQILIAILFILNLIPITTMAIILSKPLEKDTDKILN